MRYAQLRAFDAVARCLSFSRAADLLNITQPAVTLQVKSLEEAYDIRLFTRQGNETRLTGAGRELLDRTRKMFEAEEEVRDFLSDRRDLEVGELVLGADGPHVALDLVSVFQKRFPGIHVKLQLGNARSTWLDLLEHRVDAAVMAYHAEEPRIAAEQMHRSGMMLIMPKGHELAERKSFSLRELPTLPLIVREGGSNTRKSLQDAMEGLGLPFDPAMELGSREAVREAVAIGMGVGCVYGREIVGDDRITARPIREMKDSNQDSLVYLVRNGDRRLIRALRSCVEESGKLIRERQGNGSG